MLWGTKNPFCFQSEGIFRLFWRFAPIPQTVVLWGTVHHLFEYRAEIVAGGITQIIGKLCNGLLSFNQTAFCQFDFLHGNIFCRSDADGFLEFGLKPGQRVACCCSEAFQTDVFGNVIAQIIQRTADGTLDIAAFVSVDRGQFGDSQKKSGQILGGPHGRQGRLLCKQIENPNHFLKLRETQLELPARQGHELPVQFGAGFPVQTQQIIGSGQINLECVKLAGVLGLIAAAVKLQRIGDQTLIAGDMIADDLALCLHLGETGSLDQTVDLHFQYGFRGANAAGQGFGHL